MKAPTSAGKTFIAMSTGIIHKKIIYVCPAKPVAYQVGSHFILMGYKVHYLVDDLCLQSFDAKTNIFVGTPKCIEDNIHKIEVILIMLYLMKYMILTKKMMVIFMKTLLNLKL